MIRLQPVKGFVRPLLCQLDTGKARFRRKGAARIDDDNAVIRELQQLDQRLCDVYGADHEAAPRRAEHLDKDPASWGVQRCVAVAPQRLADGIQRCRIELQLAFCGVFIDQELVAAGEIGGECNRTALASGRDERIEQAPLHSTRSTKIWILPPQARPTSQAWSLVMPKSSTRGLPSRITSSPSVTTAPSTQPPETEPTNAPESASASLAPAGR